MKKMKNTQGDTLFALGCGRLFEGDGPQMWRSLSKLLPLDDDARLLRARVHAGQRAVGHEPRRGGEQRRASAAGGGGRRRQGGRVCDGAVAARGREAHESFPEAV